MDQHPRITRPTNRSEPAMNRPLFVVDEAAVLATDPEAPAC
ncbi:hypothetical protein [Streptomyces globosus]|nr:hypothetical protein [Streptomyces globosus]